MDSDFILYRYVYFVSEVNEFVFILQWNFKTEPNSSFELFQLSNIVTICPDKDVVYLYYLQSNLKIQNATRQISLKNYYPYDLKSFQSQRGFLYLKTYYFDYIQQGIQQSLVVIDPSQQQYNPIMLKIKSFDNFIHFPRIRSDSTIDNYIDYPGIRSDSTRDDIDFIITIEDNHWTFRKIHRRAILKLSVKKKFAIEDKETFQKNCQILALSSLDNSAYFYDLDLNISSQTYLQYNETPQKIIHEIDFWEDSSMFVNIIPVDILKGPIERLSFVQSDYKDLFQINIDPVIDEYNYQEPFQSQWDQYTVGYYVDHTIVNNRYIVYLFSKQILISNIYPEKQILNFTKNITNPYYDNEFDEIYEKSLKCFLSSFSCYDIFFIHCGKPNVYENRVYYFDLMNQIPDSYLKFLNNRITVQLQPIVVNEEFCLVGSYQDFLLVSSFDLKFAEKLVNIFRIKMKKNNTLELENIEITNYFENQLFYTIDVSTFQHMNQYFITLLSKDELIFIQINSHIQDGKYNITRYKVYTEKQNFQSCQIISFTNESGIYRIQLLIQSTQDMGLYDVNWTENEITMFKVMIFNNYNLCTNYQQQVLYGPMKYPQIVARVCFTYSFKKQVRSLLIYRVNETKKKQQMISFIQLPYAIYHRYSLHQIQNEWILVVPCYSSLIRIYKINLDYKLVIQQNKHLELPKFKMQLDINASNNQRDSKLKLDIIIQHKQIFTVKQHETFILKISLTILVAIIIGIYLAYIRYKSHQIKCKEQQEQFIDVYLPDIIQSNYDDDDSRSIGSNVIN